MLNPRPQRAGPVSSGRQVQPFAGIPAQPATEYRPHKTRRPVYEGIRTDVGGRFHPDGMQTPGCELRPFPANAAGEVYSTVATNEPSSISTSPGDVHACAVNRKAHLE